MLPPSLPNVPASAPASPGPNQHDQPSFRLPFRVRLTGAQLTNIGFVLAACLGALVSALYLFKGGEVFQEVAAWPRELFYGRPTPVPTATAPGVNRLIEPGAKDQQIEQDSSGDPFPATEKLLNLNPISGPAIQPNNRTTGAPFSSPSDLNGLNTLSPGGDALSRSLAQSASSVSQAARSLATGSASTGVANTTQTLANQPNSLASADTVSTAKKPRGLTSRRLGVSSNTLRPGASRTMSATSSNARKTSASGAAPSVPSSARTMSPGNQNASLRLAQPLSAAMPAIPNLGHSAGSFGAGGIGMGGGQGIGHVGGR